MAMLSMTEQDWDDLFELIEKAINQPGLSAKEKGEALRREAVERSEDGNLDEFIAQAGEQ